MKILIDCDDTLIKLCEAWVKSLNDSHNTNYTVDDIVDWDLRKCMPDIPGEDIFKPLIDQEFWKTVKPINDSQKYIKLLSEEGFDLYIVTATDYRNFSCKVENVLLKYYPEISPNHIISCSNKQMLLGDILIDDNPNNLIGGQYKKILITACHNKTFSNTYPNSDIYRIDTWEECYALIHALKDSDGKQ